ncbi:unnamed protein product [Allacma fusca]|uniref:Uncharacterized protein n=1 Tax=Allacma fusca TaxID=39272 RepID=A0A8J2K4R9_9HEXA|nr:unnamed protein product [Allacma fusca]
MARGLVYLLLAVVGLFQLAKVAEAGYGNAAGGGYGKSYQGLGAGSGGFGYGGGFGVAGGSFGSSSGGHGSSGGGRAGAFTGGY